MFPDILLWNFESKRNISRLIFKFSAISNLFNGVLLSYLQMVIVNNYLPNI